MLTKMKVRLFSPFPVECRRGVVGITRLDSGFKTGSYFGVEDEEFEEDGLEGGVCSSVGEPICGPKTGNPWVWTTIEEQTFLDIMEDCVKEGRKLEIGFKPGTFLRIEKQMEEKLSGCNLLATPHIESKYKGLKRMYYVVTDMLGSSGFGWNETLHSVEVKAEAPGDVMEDLDREEGTIGLDDMDMSVRMTGSATQSIGTKPIKKRRTRCSMTDGFTSGLQNLTAVFETYMEATGKRMEMLAERLGHTKDASLGRKKVYEELCMIDFASELDRLQVTHKIAAKQEIVDVFLCLPDDAKASYAHMLLNTDV
ncbi:hypothetical protein RJ640_003258 [Escallonia rubra]|uniref:Myb/SANT-like domain-containing protein n=1 Tax=Escallonia rubra TaxID=112253 RepID=A0AA88R1S5_9ASTE|nr:hypothetical protein RJ640_003258 [Escallonia rubra]